MKKIQYKWALVGKKSGEILCDLYSRRSEARITKSYMIDGADFTVKKVQVKVVVEKKSGT